MALEGGQNLCVPFEGSFWPIPGAFLLLFGGFWDFLEDFTSCGGALFGTFGGFYVLWGSTFWAFWRILRPVRKHFLGFSEDFTSCGGALFGPF